jgi:hypothetical protein
MRWSPEQISGWLRVDLNKDTSALSKRVKSEFDEVEQYLWEVYQREPVPTGSAGLRHGPWYGAGDSGHEVIQLERLWRQQCSAGAW